MGTFLNRKHRRRPHGPPPSKGSPLPLSRLTFAAPHAAGSSRWSSITLLGFVCIRAIRCQEFSCQLPVVSGQCRKETGRPAPGLHPCSSVPHLWLIRRAVNGRLPPAVILTITARPAAVPMRIVRERPFLSGARPIDSPLGFAAKTSPDGCLPFATR
jgi:hypothetical protein